MKEENTTKIAKGAGIVFIGTGIGMLFAYLCVMIIARFLGPTDFGLISLASTVTIIVSSIILVGLTEGVIRFVSFYRGKNDEGRIKGVIVFALKVVFPLGIIAGIFLFIFADLISIRIFHDSNLIPILKVFSFSVPFFALYKILVHTISGFQEMKYMVFCRDIFQNGIRFFSLIILLILGYGVLGVAFAYTLAIVATPFLAFYYLRKIFPGICNRKIKIISMKKELISFSLPLMFVGMIGMVMGWIDTIMLGYFLTTTDIGIYRIALSTAGILMIAPSAFGSIFYPVITEMYASKDFSELRNTNKTVTKWVFMIMLPMVLLMILFSEQVLYILYGSPFVIGALSLCILAIGNLVISLFFLTNQILPTIGRTKLVLVNTCIGAVLNVILNYSLIPVYGIVGAAFATTVSFLVVALCAFTEVYYITKMQPFKANYVKIVVASLISLVVVYVVTRFVFNNDIPIIVLVAMFILYMVLYVGLLLVLGSFEEEDIVIMKAIERKIGLKSTWIRNIIGRFL